MNPPGTLDTVDVNHLCPYDPVKAKALLAEAGYGPGQAADLRDHRRHREVGVQHHRT